MSGSMINFTPTNWINLEKAQFLEKHYLPRLNHEKRDSPNRLITSIETESVSKTLQEKPRPDGFPSECYSTFKKLIPILLKLFQKTEE